MFVRIELLRAFLIEDKHTPLAKRVFKLRKNFVTSSAILLQLICDLEKKRKDIKVLDKLKKIKTLKVVPLDGNTILKAIKYKNKYKLSIFDAITVVTCLSLNEELLTVETTFSKIPGIKWVDPFKLIRN